MGGFGDRILSLPAWLAVSLVFLLPALEASAFLGFIFPGEIAVVIGGVLAYRGVAPLPVILTAGILGAIIGDNIGYFVGRRWGRGILDSTLGRYIKADHIDSGQRLLARKGAIAVFTGRWTAALRALIPGLAGMSDMHYRTFFVWNVIGGTIWATTFILLGYAAGNNYKHLEHVAHNATLMVLGVVVLICLGAVILHRRRKSRELRGD